MDSNEGNQVEQVVEEEEKDQTLNTSNDSAKANGRASVRKEQFTSKQRLDMYAFCVLELEMHSNTVSIKKRQQAIKRAISKGKVKMESQEALGVNHDKIAEGSGNQVAPPAQITITTPTPTASTTSSITTTPIQAQPTSSTITAKATATTTPTTNTVTSLAKSAVQTISQSVMNQPGAKIVVLTPDMARQLQQQGAIVQRIDEAHVSVLTDDEKSLEQLQRDISSNLKCYSDYQKTLVLTSAMLKNVQARFAKYYPNTVVPSRTTIKHVFEKCVAHGNVDNIKNPRKPSKITQGSEIELLLEREPQLSLRQLAARLNVSVGTISRRCKALGLIPESVTIKHQQLAIARRQKQMNRQQSGDITPSKIPSPQKGGRSGGRQQAGGGGATAAGGGRGGSANSGRGRRQNGSIAR